jgi:hypothetical protein
MNAVWHAKHPMPPRATHAQRVAWHRAHAKHCGCRPIPPKLRRLMRSGRRHAGRPSITPRGGRR